MPDKHIVSLLLAFSILGSVLVSNPFKEGFWNDDIDISYSAGDDIITVKAIYPKAKSKRVHLFVQQHLHLTDLPDLSNVEIKEYHSPDRFLSIYINSRNGYFKVVMKKNINTPTAQESMKLLAEGVGKALAEN